MKISRPLKFIVRWISRLHILLFRLTRGRIGGRMMRSPVLLLTTRGRKTGRRYTAPLFYLEDGGTIYIVASFAGSDVDPIWWRNLQKNPAARVELPRGRSFSGTARQVDAETKSRLWPKFVAMYPDYDVYQKRTTRDIPVVALEPGGPG